MKKAVAKRNPPKAAAADYSRLVGGIAELLETARRTSARALNTLITATYWEIGRRIVEFEQHGRDRPDYGAAVVDRLAEDLSARLGRGFSRRNVFQMRAFYLAFSNALLQAAVAPSLPTQKVQTASALSSGDLAGKVIVQTTSGKSATPPICSTPSSIFQTVSGKSSLFKFNLRARARAFPLPWSHYVLLVSGARSPEALEFYQTEALRGGWSVRQLRRQMDSPVLMADL